MTRIDGAALRGATLFLAFALSSCTSERASEGDGGIPLDGGSAHDQDAAPPVAGDAGGAPDGGSVADGGPEDSTDAATTDAATPECALSATADVPPLPAACLPRCSAETYACVSACGDDLDCEDECLARDTTPAITMHINDFTVTLACAANAEVDGCVAWQTTSCVVDACPDEYAACIRCGDRCDRGSPECEVEDSALYDCLIPVLGEVEACMDACHAECFDL